MEPILQERVNIVRQYEVHCYSVCYYLLQDEKLAVMAAQEVVARLLQDERICEGSDSGIRLYIKKESMKQSLRVIYSEE